MKKQFIIPFVIFTHLSCGQKNDVQASVENVPVEQALTERVINDNSTDFDTPITQQNDIIEWYKSYKKEGVKIQDDFGNDITAKIMTVINNYDKINAHTDWTDYGESFYNDEENSESELVEVTKYNINGKLAKITTEEYRKQSRIISEYYLLDGKLSFVFEVCSNYNRPYDYDEKTAKANNDSEHFDIEKSSITVYAHFFQNGKLFHAVINDKDTQNQIIISDIEDLKIEHDKIVKRFNQVKG